MNTCPICDSSAFQPLLHQRAVPVLLNKLCDTPEDAASTPKGDLDFVICRNCDIAFNQHFDFRQLDYSAAYDSSSARSESFTEYLAGMARDISARIPKGGFVVEIGSGKGDFLRALVALRTDISALGIDQSHEGPLSEAGGRLVFERRLFGEKDEHVKAQAVLIRLVLEAVQNPLHLLSLASDSVRRGEGIVIVETARLDWMLDKLLFWEFYYERHTIYGLRALGEVARRAGLSLTESHNVFGQQYAVSTLAHGREIATTSLHTESLRFAQEYRSSVAAWSRFLAAHSGGVAVWGAGSRGAAFLNALDAHSRLVSCVVDLNERKQGRFVPGTGHPIVAPASLAATRPSFVLVTNPKYLAEILALVRALGIGARVELALGSPPEDDVLEH